MTVPETDLSALLKNLSPRLNAGEFVFVTIKDKLPAMFHPLASFREWEGESVILRVEQAETIGLRTRHRHLRLDHPGRTFCPGIGRTHCHCDCCTRCGGYPLQRGSRLPP